jgi:hypothetical protein
MVLVLELVDPPILLFCIRSGSGTGTGGLSYSVSGRVWMVLVLELVDPLTLERTKAIQVFPDYLPLYQV